MYALI